jgi:hypothetical protein
VHQREVQVGVVHVWVGGQRRLQVRRRPVRLSGVQARRREVVEDDVVVWPALPQALEQRDRVVVASGAGQCRGPIDLLREAGLVTLDHGNPGVGQDRGSAAAAGGLDPGLLRVAHGAICRSEELPAVRIVATAEQMGLDHIDRLVRAVGQQMRAGEPDPTTVVVRVRARRLVEPGLGRLDVAGVEQPLTDPPVRRRVR